MAFWSLAVFDSRSRHLRLRRMANDPAEHSGLPGARNGTPPCGKRPRNCKETVRRRSAPGLKRTGGSPVFGLGGTGFKSVLLGWNTCRVTLDHLPVVAVLHPNLQHGQRHVARRITRRDFRTDRRCVAIDVDVLRMDVEVSLRFHERFDCLLFVLQLRIRVAVLQTIGEDLLERRAISRLCGLVECVMSSSYGSFIASLCERRSC